MERSRQETARGFWGYEAKMDLKVSGRSLKLEIAIRWVSGESHREMGKTEKRRVVGIGSRNIELVPVAMVRAEALGLHPGFSIWPSGWTGTANWTHLASWVGKTVCGRGRMMGRGEVNKLERA